MSKIIWVYDDEADNGLWVSSPMEAHATEAYVPFNDLLEARNRIAELEQKQ